MKEKILNKISGQEALEILKCLSKKDPIFAHQIEKEAKRLLRRIDLDEISKDVFFDLDGLDVRDLWDGSGTSRYGYISPEEKVVEMIKEELEPYTAEIIKYLELRMTNEAKLYCMGVLKGIYRYVHESKSEFKDWTRDIPEENFGYLLRQWKNGTKDKNDYIEMESFLKKECPDWSDWALKKIMMKGV